MTRVFNDSQESGRPTAPRDTPPSPRLSVTTRRNFVVAVLSGAVVGWFLVSTFDLLDKSVPVTPWTMSVILVVLGIVSLVGSVWVKARLREPQGLTSEQGVMALVFGKTIALTGAILAGGHLSYVLTNLGSLDIPLPRSRVIFGSIAIVASAFFAFAGWVLERSCVVDDKPEDDASDPSDQPF